MKRNASIHMKFGTKLNLCLLFCALVPAAITVLFFYRQLINNTVSDTLESRQNTLSSLEFSMENYIGELLGVLDAVSGDSRLSSLLSASYEDLASAQSDAGLPLFRTAQLFQSATEAYLKEGTVSTIKIYTEADTKRLNALCTPELDTIFEPMGEIEYSYWKGLMEITGETSRIFPGYYLTSSERENLGNISCVRKLTYFSQNQKKSAYLAVYSYEDRISKLLSDAATEEDEMYYLIDSNDYMITLSQNIADKFGLYMQDYDKWNEEYKDGHSFRLKDFGQGDDYAAAYPIRHTQWIMVWIIPRSSIIGTSSEVLRDFLLLYAFALVVIVFLMWRIIHQLLGRLIRLKDHMNTVHDESPKEYTQNSGSDEIGELIKAYNYMIRQNNLLHQQEVKNLNELNQLRVEVMRSQIDPHFLYNTLDMIRWMSANGNQSDVEKAIKLLSRFYRLTTNKGNQLIQVRYELEHVELYMELMNMRFKNRIRFVIDVPDEMMDLEIPVLIFQPIVENAISHGIFEKESQSGCITITGWMDMDYLYFEIADDGVGMTQEQITRILCDQAAAKAGIGVFHTRRRLRILYRDQADLIFRSTVGVGTEAEYRIPIAIPILGEDIHEKNI